MSLKLFIFAFLVIGFVSCQDGLWTGFDYTNQGNDWDYSDCVNTTNFVVQNLSPQNLTVNTTQKWGYYYYFLPQYASAVATVKQYNITVEFNATSEFGRVYTVTAGKQIGIYQATSIRIHSEAEHVVNNTRYPVELQIYHQLIDSRTPANKYQANLFVSVFFDVSPDGTPSELLGNITNAIANNATTATIDFGTMFSLASTRTEVYSYGGTQTFPPCYPASWLVFPQVHYASADQIKVIHDLYHNNANFNGNGNYRQVQPLHPYNQTYLLNPASDLITSMDL